MISLEKATATTPAAVTASQKPHTPWQRVRRLHYITWICLFLACLGASWFSYQYFLVPQPRNFAPDWQGAQWIQATNGNAPVAYFRTVTSLKTFPDDAFITVTANQTFRLYVNGNLIGSNATDFGAGRFPRAYMYSIATALHLGSNAIGLRVTNADQDAPTLRASLGIVWGRFVSYFGTGRGWQATSQSEDVYPLRGKNTHGIDSWTGAAFDASSWPPAQIAASPHLSPLLTVNPLLYEQPIATHWISAGVSHNAYFLRQFSLSGNRNGAWLRIVTNGTAHIFLNGQMLIQWNGQLLTSSDQTSTSNLNRNKTSLSAQPRLPVGVFDISPYLHSGLNTLAIHVIVPQGATQVGSNNASATMSIDVLIDGSQGYGTWLTPDIGWYASDHPVDGWTQGSHAALAWPRPTSIAQPATISAFSLPNSDALPNIPSVPFSLLAVTILASVGTVLGLWLLISLFVMRRYASSRRAALGMMSLAYLPAVVFEAVLVALTRESLIPSPFPYTLVWGTVLVLLVGMGYILLWLNARSIRSRTTRNQKPSQGTLHKQYLFPTRKRQPSEALPARARAHSGYWQIKRWYTCVGAWLRLHWALIPIVLVVVPLICYNLSYEHYWQDEWTSFYAAKGILAHGLPVFPSRFIYPKGELYSYVLAFSMLILGDQGGTPRIVSIIAFLVSLPLFYSVGCYFFNRHIALLATAMLAFSPTELQWGQSVRMYELAQLLTILVMYLFYRVVQKRRRVRQIYLACVCLLAMYLSHEETFIVLPAIALWVLLATRDREHRLPTVFYQKHWWFAGMIAVGGIALQLLIVRVTHPPILGTDQSQQPLIQFTTDNIPYYLKQLFFPAAINSALPWITVNSILASIGCVWALRRNDRRAKYCVLFLLISFCTLVFAFTLTSDRYIYPLLPFYYLMGAYTVVMVLRVLWAFARPHLLLQQPRKTTTVVATSHLVQPVKGVATLMVSLLCMCVLVLPMLPISGYNLLVSRLAGLSYHHHFPDYNAAGRYIANHRQQGDIIITVTPSISVLYYVGHIDYLFSVDRALYLFERNGHIIDTPTNTIEVLLNQSDFQAVLDTYKRIWIISDNGEYQSEISKRFVFPPDFHIVYEGYGSAVYLRGG